MGADIHLYVERLNDDMKWGDVPAPAGSRYGEWYDGRNYSLFAMLAGVRNGYGFAGCDIGKPITPISSPRGIPTDASPEYAKEAGDYVPCPSGEDGCDHDEMHGGWGEDGHSHSWLTARELHDVDWDQPITHHGWVTPTSYDTFRRTGDPSDSRNYLDGPDGQHVSNQEMEVLIDSGAVEIKPDEGYFSTADHYTKIAWTVPWRAAAGENWMAFLKALNKLSRDDGRDVRIVFFFDN